MSSGSSVRLRFPHCDRGRGSRSVASPPALPLVGVASEYSMIFIHCFFGSGLCIIFFRVDWDISKKISNVGNQDYEFGSCFISDPAGPVRLHWGTHAHTCDPFIGARSSVSGAIKHRVHAGLGNGSGKRDGGE